MLITCPECGKEISDKSIMCIGCGYPINNKAINLPTRRKTTRRMKLPNGYGSIRYLGSKRRNPYGAYLPVTDYSDNGTAVLPKPLGFFETYNEAYECLAMYHANGMNYVDSNITFAKVYEMFYEDKFVKNQKRVYSKSLINSTKASFNNLKELHNVPISDINAKRMQDIIDSCPLRHASIELIVALLKNVFQYAMKHDYIKKDYSQYIKINIPDDDEKGVPFTKSEIELLWENSDKKYVKLALVLIYTGVRISEIKTFEYHLDERYVIGGIKTDAGKGRFIPISNLIMPFMNEISEFPKDVGALRTRFEETLTELGISNTADGLKHTPHDCRHTFSYLADKYQMDELSKHLIMGHSIKKLDIEMSIYGHRTNDDLIKAIDCIKRV